jgi:hypothetical protein
MVKIAEEQFESQQNQPAKSPRKLHDTTYYAEQPSDLPMETEMEEALTAVELSFSDMEKSEDEIRNDVRLGYGIALRFVRKYAADKLDLKTRIKQIIIDAANGIDMDYLMKEHDSLADTLLPLAKDKGFGRQAQPTYAWEYKFRDATAANGDRRARSNNKRGQESRSS